MEKFKVIEHLGKGSYGKVDLAVELVTEQEVAIKTILNKKIQSTRQKMLNPITREISVLQEVSHPSLIHLYAVYHTHHATHLILERAQIDLLAYLKQRGRLQEIEAIPLMYQVLQGLIYLHSQGIAHRDIKLSNLLLTGSGKIKIADYGLSNRYKKGEKLLTSCGSPTFACPEIIEGKAYDPQEADVWSFGVIIYSIIEGNLPYFNENINLLYKAITEIRYKYPIHGSRECIDLLKKIFVYDPNKRIKLKKIREHPFFQGVKNEKKVAQTEIEIKRIEKIMKELGYQRNQQGKWRKIVDNLVTQEGKMYYEILLRSEKTQLQKLLHKLIKNRSRVFSQHNHFIRKGIGSSKPSRPRSQQDSREKRRIKSEYSLSPAKDIFQQPFLRIFHPSTSANNLNKSSLNSFRTIEQLKQCAKKVVETPIRYMGLRIKSRIQGL